MNHADYASSLNNLGEWYRVTGDHAAALPICRQALEITRTALGENHPGYATSLNNLALLYNAMGDHAAALPLYRQALEIRRTALGVKHPDYAESLDNLAELYRAMGDYAASLPLCRQALEIRRTALGENHPDYATTLSIMATLHHEMGDHAAALPLLRQALEICRAALGVKHRDYAAMLNNLASLYQGGGGPRRRAGPPLPGGGDHPRCAGREPPALCAKPELPRHAVPSEGGPRRRSPPQPPGAGDPPHGTGREPPGLCPKPEQPGRGCTNGDGGLAPPLCPSVAWALEIRCTALGENHPDYAQSLNNLAGLHHEMGDHAAALPLFRQALEIDRRALGENHRHFATSLNNLAALHAARGLASEALPLMEQAAAIDDRMIGQLMAIGSERQRMAYLSTLQGRLYVFLSLVLPHFSDSPVPVLARPWTWCFDARPSPPRHWPRSAMPCWAESIPAWSPSCASWLRCGCGSRAAPASLARKPRSHGGKSLGEWNDQRERLEAELAGRIPEMNLEKKLRAGDLHAVALNLPAGVVLVGTCAIPGVWISAVPARGEPEWKPARYVAFVLPGGAPDEVRMIDLGEAEPIDRLIADFRAGIIAEAETGDGRDMAEGSRSDRRERCRLGPASGLVNSLAPALGSGTRVLISPDGDLARFPFEVLPTVDGRRVIDDYQISYLNCGRDVLRFDGAHTGQPGEPLVVADPDFDVETVTSSGPAQPKAGFWSRLLGHDKTVMAPLIPSTITVDYTPTITVDYTPAMRNRDKGSTVTSIPSVPALTPTARPVGRRSRDLDRDHNAYHFHRLPGTRAEGQRIANRLGVSPWLDAAAMEGRLKTACRSPRILHLATHGFFLPDQERDPNREGPVLGFDLREFSAAQGGPGGSRDN